MPARSTTRAITVLDNPLALSELYIPGIPDEIIMDAITELLQVRTGFKLPHPISGWRLFYRRIFG
jgi:hypothetical protein